MRAPGAGAPGAASGASLLAVRICVLVKEVPDVTVRKRIDPSTGRLDRTGDGRLNPYDAHAVEAAVVLRERRTLPVQEIVAVTMGPPSAARVLQQALARGADRAIHLTDPALAGSDLNGTAHALACVLARAAPDLVVAGQQSDDGECYALACAVAEHLGLPPLSQVVEIAGAEGGLACRRQAEYGYDEVSIALPAVISVAEGINEPRYPSLKGIMAARAKPVETVSAAQAGVDLGRVGHANARALCFEFADPAPREPGRVIEGADPDAAVRAILEWLDERGLAA